MTRTVMLRWKDSWELQPGRTEKWSYDQGVVLEGLDGLWLNTADEKYFRFIQQSIDRFVKDDGTIRTYEIDEYNIDHITNEGWRLMRGLRHSPGSTSLGASSLPPSVSVAVPSKT